MTKSPFGGVIAPALTPFDGSGAPDPKRFLAHCRWLLEDGCTGLAPFGTTSEANSLGQGERMKLFEGLIEGGLPAGKLMAGTGMCSIPDAVALTKHAVGLGAGGVLMLPPFYYKGVPDDGLFAFYSEVIDKVGSGKLRLYLYHIPPVAQVPISYDLVARLTKAFPKSVVGLKDSSGDWNNTKGLIERFAEQGFEVFSGSEATLLSNLRAGGTGCISATANVNAKALRKLFDSSQSGEADALQEGLSGVRKLVQSKPLIPMLKAIVAHYRKDEAWLKVRPPLPVLSKAETAPLIAELEGQHGFAMQFTAPA